MCVLQYYTQCKNSLVHSFPNFVLLLTIYLIQYFFDRLISAQGLSETDALFAISMVAVGNTFSKIVCGVLCDKEIIGTYEMYTWSHILSGLVGCCIFLAKDRKFIKFALIGRSK